MNNFKKHLPLIVRIIISFLFILSAVAKSFPIWAFEKQLVDLGIVDWCAAPYLSRLIIALETAIAIAILQKHFIKSFVIPVTIFLLIAFCVHLSIQMYEHGAMNGNCGCFGQLIPMTPLEAVIKNIVTILLLVYLFRNVEDKPKGQNNFIVILFIYFLSAFIMFFLFPFCPCNKKADVSSLPSPIVAITDSSSETSDTISEVITTKKIDTSELKIKPKDTTAFIAKVIEPKKTVSIFAPYTDFSGKKVNLDDGKKIVCLFVPGCDHCREAAKEIVALSKKQALPPVYVLFMNEELYQIPDFFKEVNRVFPYYIIDDIPTFFKLLGNKGSTPGVSYLWNGNIIKSFEGLESHKFNADELLKAINQP
jgi:thiol-disulfide isomerase/thioredoxin